MSQAPKASKGRLEPLVLKDPVVNQAKLARKASAARLGLLARRVPKAKLGRLARRAPKAHAANEEQSAYPVIQA